MESLKHFALGVPFPDSPHAVISSLPTMADVRGYEEKEPRVLNALKSGYPRFVVHEFVHRLIDFYSEREGLSGRYAMLVSGRRSADDLLGWLGEGFEKMEVDQAVYLVFCDASEDRYSHDLRKFIQHTGCGISSRQAEDLLLQHGLLEERFEETSFRGNPLNRVESDLAGLIGCRESDVLVCASGMNAFYAGFRAAQELQQSRGRTAWLRLGWLYLDSGKILEQFLGEGETLDCLYNAFDLDAALERIGGLGESLAAVVVECPSNPLIQMPELCRVAQAVREQGGVMIVDPTIASIYNVDVLPCADLLVTSLTKYAAIEGDVMAGALAVNPESPFYGDLILRTSSFHVPPYGRDFSRLAYEMEAAPEVITAMNANAERLCAFLRGHPAVKKIHCAGGSRQIEAVVKEDGSVGAVVSIELEGDMEKFYDTVRLMKGPSFGTRYTLLCPFMYLAHYDLVTSEEGRAFLRSIGIDPELIRISVGEEPYEAIGAVIGEALDASMSC
ncbi:MAG: PLP-dependent transferase [Verrucomicrobiota bacterium]